MIFLGLASNYRAKSILKHTFALGRKKDYLALERELSNRYRAPLENTSLIYSGRSAISVALKSFILSGKIEKGDFVAVNAFTCFAVIEAIKNAELVPVYVDLEKTESGEILPNYSAASLEALKKKNEKLKVFILQNTFGLPVNIESFLKVKEKYHLLLLEDLAHSVGRFYETSSGEKIEIGTVGDATCLSFGKGKAIDTILGGAVILRNPDLSLAKIVKKSLLLKTPVSDSLRAAAYPLLAAIARGFAHLHLEKYWLGLLLKLKWIERSADTKLRELHTITPWQAKLALSQLTDPKLPTIPLREYYLVKDREIALEELESHGIRLEESWYEVPVSPRRYFNSLNFPTEACPNATFFAAHILNLPTWYHSSDKKHQSELALAKRILKKHLLKPEN